MMITDQDLDEYFPQYGGSSQAHDLINQAARHFAVIVRQYTQTGVDQQCAVDYIRQAVVATNTVRTGEGGRR